VAPRTSGRDLRRASASLRGRTWWRVPIWVGVWSASWTASPPLGVESADDEAGRKVLLRTIGSKL